ncbi:XRE family transcriptional regulator [Nocardia sp. CA-129566]|uniref:XRE family transcriptional regulator n=1 Tax=Nocardia sp. CA-129566 TaxID=3239976 RepID=UPI003D9718F7
MPIESLGFGSVEPGRSLSSDDENGHVVDSPIGQVPHESATATPRPANGNYNGIWLSRYEYYSSGRNATFTAVHHVVVLQHDDALTVRSLPESAISSMEMDLTIDGNVATGTWTERTAPDGYYRGAKYHGAIQLLIELTGTRMAGKWIGFGKSFDINSGPWELILQDRSTSKATIEAFSRPPEA